MAWVDAEFPFSHNLAFLMQLCEDADLALPESLAEADLPTPYAAHLRYGRVPSGTVSRAQALELAGDATGWAGSVVES